MELRCEVIGEGIVVTVTIAHDAEVRSLQEAIAVRIKGRPTLCAATLTLYLARNNEDERVVNDSKAMTVLSQDDSRSTFVKLQPFWRLDDEEVFGRKPLPPHDGIHILVQLPFRPTLVQDNAVDCGHPFFCQLLTTRDVDDWLQCSCRNALTMQTKLYVRSAYREIADQALVQLDDKTPTNVLVTGTPGTGKSVFLLYVMWKLIKQCKRVLFLAQKPAIYFDGNSFRSCEKLPKTDDSLFWSSSLWCLVDGADPMSLEGYPWSTCSTFLASAPRWDCIGQFISLHPQVFVMPLWSKDELGAIAPMYPKAATVWESRFECLGGVPRAVFVKSQLPVEALLKAACTKCSVEDCIDLSVVSLERKFNHAILALVHMTSQAPYRSFKVDYASNSARSAIAQTKRRLLWRYHRAKMLELVRSCPGCPVAASLRGYVFEDFAICELEKGGTFACRPLLSDANAVKRRRLNPPTEAACLTTRVAIVGPHAQAFEIQIPPSSRLQVDRVDSKQHANQLYVPKDLNYPVLDAWMPNIGGFQMTLAMIHDIKEIGKSDLERLGNRIYFVLPSRTFPSFKHQATPLDVEQFAILVPYP